MLRSSPGLLLVLTAACAGAPAPVHVIIVHETVAAPAPAERPAAVETTVVAAAPVAPPAPPAAEIRAAPAHAGPPHWEYEGPAGPEHWGELDPAWEACGKGQKQSPIDLEEARRHRASPIVFGYRPTPARIVDNGHTVQVSFERGSWIEIDRHRYDLVQLHVHSPSEHTVRGQHHAMELHLVHKDAAGKLAVIGVFYDDGMASPALGYVWDHWPAEQQKEEKLGYFDAGDVLPADRSVTRYDGSLTTPPCSEGVVWNVMSAGRTDSTAHLEALRGKYPMNARPTIERDERSARAERGHRH